MVLFFFKQTPAYEMRISDWSSDVCSSDLEGEALRRDRRQIGQLLDLIIGPDAARLMPLPDDRRVARFGPAPCGVAERCVPAPRVGADHLHPALRQIECRLCAHAAALIGKIVGAIDRARLDEYDIARLQEIGRAAGRE